MFESNTHKKRNSEELGKYFLKKAVDFALDRQFGKAYEFIKEGLDFLTCDCSVGGWKDNYLSSKKDIFNDLEVRNCNNYEYYFTKAFLLRNDNNKKNTYLALDAIERYLNVVNDEYGLYIKAAILFKLNNSTEEALNLLYESKDIRTTSLILYRIGRFKEQELDEFGIYDLYQAFLENPSSVCCCRILQKNSKKRSISLDLNENNHSNILVKGFLSIENEWEFQSLYEATLNNSDINLSDNNQNSSVVIDDFLCVLKNNHEKFKPIISYDENDYSEDYYEYYDNDYEDSNYEDDRTYWSDDEEDQVMRGLSEGEGDRFGF